VITIVQSTAMIAGSGIGNVTVQVQVGAATDDNTIVQQGGFSQTNIIDQFGGIEQTTEILKFTGASQDTWEPSS